MKTLGRYIGRGIAQLLGGIAIIAAFLVWGYLHQVFSFADCGQGGKPDLGFGAIIAAGFGMTSCVVPSTSKTK